MVTAQISFNGGVSTQQYTALNDALSIVSGLM
jgi:hypothetical protein